MIPDAVFIALIVRIGFHAVVMVVLNPMVTRFMERVLWPYAARVRCIHTDIPCELLYAYAVLDPDHGDNPPGARIAQCKRWLAEYEEKPGC